MAKDVFFDDQRKQIALEELSILVQGARNVGIYNHFTLGFGTLLGVVMGYDFIPDDNDIDVCIDADNVTKEQEVNYFNEISKANMFRHREKGPYYRGDNGRFLWFSCGKYPKRTGVKCCHWFTFRYNGFVWHTKGRDWIHKFLGKKAPWLSSSYEAIAKGLPEKYCNENTEISFHGVNVNIPLCAGHCADIWYPGWDLERNGSQSKAQRLLGIKKWKDQKTWQIH